MKTVTQSTSKKACTFDHRTVLCVDPDESCAFTLRKAWSQLRLADDLHIVYSPAAALEFLHSIQGKNENAPMAAVILDPDATGEETGSFVRKVRKQCGENAVPIVFWSQNSDKYKVLEGRGVQSVLKKPMVLRLIQTLESTCQLKARSFRPFIGNSAFVDTSPQSNIGVRA